MGTDAAAPAVSTIARRPWPLAVPALLRVHQWAKNLLVFVPLLAAHRYTDLPSLIAVALAFVAFSLCASSVYILNDIVDLAADREHPRKRFRPLAAGEIPVGAALAAAVMLLGGGFALAAAVSPRFAAVLAVYYAVTAAYSFVLKRLMLIDAVTLACLYALRVVAGGAAADIRPSTWLLAFSMFLFLSLALVKRYTELAERADLGAADPTNRDYRAADLPVLGALAAAAGFNAVTVFALYISSDSVLALYRSPQVLWLVMPVLVFWLGRVLLLAHRRRMPDDPVVFALRDPVSLACGGVVAGLLVAGTVAL